MVIKRITKENRSMAKKVLALFSENEEKQINEDFFSDEKNIFYVAIKDDQIMGYVYGYVFERFDMTKKQLFLYAIDVLETHQRQGIGKSLINTFLNHLDEKAFYNAFVFTNANNEAAKKLYESTGAKEARMDEDENILFRWTPIKKEKIRGEHETIKNL